MVKQKQTIQVSSGNEYLFSETVETDEGSFIIGARKNVIDIAEMYQHKLMAARGIPIDWDNIAPRDPKLREMEQTMPWLKTMASRIAYLKQYYAQQNQDAYKSGIMLAVFADTRNQFSIAPEPYANEEYSLPGLEDGLKNPVLNLNNPLERRLKQLLDFLNRHANELTEPVEKLLKFVDGMDGEEVDEDNFQLQRTD